MLGSSSIRLFDAKTRERQKGARIPCILRDMQSYRVFFYST